MNGSTTPVQQDVLGRLESAGLADKAYEYALAALLGELDGLLEGRQVSRPPPSASEPPPRTGAFVESVSVQGFRGIGARTTLPLTPGPGLTLVVGRNGSGKSSFAEALEVLLTGDNRRWSASRSKIWRDGWRNLHRPDPASVEAVLFVEGSAGKTIAKRTWQAGTEFGDATAALSQGVATRPLSALGWQQALAIYRPFLSYNELGSVLEEGPARLFDALGSILGLEELVEAADALKQARARRVDAHKDVKRTLEALREQLAGSADPRAATCLAALKGSRWKLDDVEAVLGPGAPGTAPDLRALHALTQLTIPALDEITDAVASYREAFAALDRVGATDAGRARMRADLLASALTLHAKEGDGDCPVCGSASALEASWCARAAEEIKLLRSEAAAAEAAHYAVRVAERDLRAKLVAPPAVLDQASEAGVDVTVLRAAWDAWHGGAALDGLALPQHAEDQILLLHDALGEAQARAAATLAEREDAWRPIAKQLSTWLRAARAMLADRSVVDSLKAAEDWVRQTEVSMRNERFQPIKLKVKHIWSRLRARSNVALDDVTFEGRATQRRISLDVTVDGTPGAALGVMSQGELHSLALALFLPRATLDTSPFRFLFIDDPVQSMDPVRVEGLARVLDDVAKERQVVVFTHDDRLADATRRLGIPATVLEVQRGEGSHVNVRQTMSPRKQYIEDALVVAKTPELPPSAVRRVVPGLCRQSLEAACIEVVRRRRLAAGQLHEQIDALLEEHTRLLPRLALALFDDPERGGEVYRSVANRFGQQQVETVRACNTGAHEGLLDGDVLSFVRRVETLSDGIVSA